MKDKYIIIAILIIIAVLFLYNKQENIDANGLPLSNEAVQGIASVYNNQNMQVTNLTATNLANIKDAKISNNLNVDGISTLNNINVSGTSILNNLNVSNTTRLNNLNVSGNIITNNKGMVTWRQQILRGKPQQVQAKDPSGNVYNADEWFIYAAGWGVHGIGNCQPFIDPTSKTWFIRMWAVENEYNNHIDVLAIPKGYFSNVFTNTFG